MESFFRVDESLCIRCGACYEECPPGIILKADEDALPEILPESESACIHCGHCVAVCPVEAFSHRCAKPEECQEINKYAFTSADGVESIIRARRSIRTYTEKPVERAVLARLLDAVRYVPTARNLQPLSYICVETPAEKDRLSRLVIEWMRKMVAENDESFLPASMMERIIGDWEEGFDRIGRGAPHMIVAHGPATLPATDSSAYIALASLELIAFAMGLGTCWGGYYAVCANRHPPMKEALGISSENKCGAVMMIGRPVHAYPRIPPRKAPEIIWR
jgi:nitroreductase/NAD-dependent dihydropyrimidine dehydrogenase PreA subunit